jgi:hypothetical protein
MIEKYKLLANENYFSGVIKMLGEKGVFLFKDAGVVYQKQNGKLTGTREELDKVKDLVSPEFFDQNFTIKK